MKRYVTLTIASGTGEILTDALSGLGEKKRKIVSLRPIVEENTTNVYDRLYHHVKAYKNQDEIVDFDYGSFQNGLYSSLADVSETKLIDLDLQLERGDGFKVGFEKATNEGGRIIIEYIDQE